MERKISAVVVLAGLVFVMSGCGDGSTDAPTAAISSQQQTAAPKADSPQDAVQSFLEAVRRGDRETARGMLTPLAIQKTEEHNLNFSPPGSETATFQIGDVQRVENRTAHVASVWNDLDENGNPRPEQITWVVKQDGSGWRISGMIAEIGPGQPPAVFNFEQPDELLRRQDRVAEEPQTRDLPDRQASLPEDPFQQASPK